MSPFWRICRHRLHGKLSKRKPAMELVMKISLKWHFRVGVSASTSKLETWVLIITYCEIWKNNIMYISASDVVYILYSGTVRWEVYTCMWYITILVLMMGKCWQINDCDICTFVTLWYQYINFFIVFFVYTWIPYICPVAPFTNIV